LHAKVLKILYVCKCFEKFSLEVRSQARGKAKKKKKKSGSRRREENKRDE
jgi:hypothetical protein